MAIPIEDTHTENTLLSKTPALAKYTNTDIWMTGTFIEIFIDFYTRIKFFEKIK